MIWKYSLIFFLWPLLLLATVSNANEQEVSGIFGVSEVTEPLSIAIWIPLASGESVEGMSWYNNDASAIFPEIKPMAGVVGRPDELKNAVIIGEDIAGRSSSWSEFNFARPIASTANGIYIVFEVPTGGALVANGTGGGHGVGYQMGDGMIRCWISTETGTWDALAPEFQMAVVPTIALNKSGNILTLERGRSGADPATLDPNAVELVLESSMVAVPNPFNSTTEIKYALTHSGHVTLELYDIRGRVVQRLVNENRSAGVHSASWNGRDDVGRTVPSGNYLALMRSGGVRIVRRLTLLK